MSRGEDRHKWCENKKYNTYTSEERGRFDLEVSQGARILYAYAWLVVALGEMSASWIDLGRRALRARAGGLYCVDKKAVVWLTYCR